MKHQKVTMMRGESALNQPGREDEAASFNTSAEEIRCNAARLIHRSKRKLWLATADVSSENAPKALDNQ